MKTLNKAISVVFLTLSVLAGIFSILYSSFQLGCLALVFGGISYVAYKDYNDPQ